MWANRLLGTAIHVLGLILIVLFKLVQSRVEGFRSEIGTRAGRVFCTGMLFHLPFGLLE